MIPEPNGITRVSYEGAFVLARLRVPLLWCWPNSILSDSEFAVPTAWRRVAALAELLGLNLSDAPASVASAARAERARQLLADDGASLSSISVYSEIEVVDLAIGAAARLSLATAFEAEDSLRCLPLVLGDGQSLLAVALGFDVCHCFWSDQSKVLVAFNMPIRLAAGLAAPFKIAHVLLLLKQERPAFAAALRLSGVWQMLEEGRLTDAFDASGISRIRPSARVWTDGLR